MNKEYAYTDGKVIISDENGKLKTTLYYDNLDDVLVQENVIEAMEERIDTLKKDSQSYKKNNSKYFIPFLSIITTIMSTVGVNLMIFLLLGENPFTTHNVLNINDGVLITLLTLAIILPYSVLVDLNMYNKHKKLLKKEKGTNSELEYLQKQIVKEKQKLEDLKKEKKKDLENKELSITKVNDKQKLEALKNILLLYFDLGYNKEKYLRYLNKNKLDNKLKKNYQESEINIIKEYLEEQAPTLARRKK